MYAGDVTQDRNGQKLRDGDVVRLDESWRKHIAVSDEQYDKEFSLLEVRFVPMLYHKSDGSPCSMCLGSKDVEIVRSV